MKQIVTTLTPTQHNINTVVGLDMKMTLHTTPPPRTHPQKLNVSYISAVTYPILMKL